MFLSTVWGWKSGPLGHLDIFTPTYVLYLIHLHIHIEHFCPGFQGFCCPQLPVSRLYIIDQLVSTIWTHRPLSLLSSAMADFYAQMDFLDSFCCSLAKFSTAMAEAQIVYREMMVMEGHKFPLVTSRYFANNKKRSNSSSTSTPRKRLKISTVNPISVAVPEVMYGTEIPVVSTSKKRARSLAGTTLSTGTRLVMDAVEIPISTIPSKTPIQQDRLDGKPEGKLVKSHYFPSQVDTTPSDAQPVLRAPLLEKEIDQEPSMRTSRYFTVSTVPVTVKKKTHSLRIPLTLPAEMAPPAIQAPERWWEADSIPVTRKRNIARFKKNPVLYYSVWNAKPTLIQGIFKCDAWAALLNLKPRFHRASS